MTYSWNVYKLFKSGKRAKAPVVTFEHENGEDVDDFFDNNIKTTFAGRALEAKYLLLRSDLSQVSEIRQTDDKNKKFLVECGRIVTQNLTEAGKSVENLGSALVYCKESQWKWQWAAIERGTGHYAHGASPLFNSGKEADEWMNEKISQNT